MNSKKIEAAVEKVEKKLNKSGLNVNIYVFRDSCDRYKVEFDYDRGEQSIEEVAKKGIAEEDLLSYIEIELYNHINGKIHCDLHDAMWAINKFMYYSWNYELTPVTLYHGKTVYVPTFIKEVKWNCNLDHIVSKWMDCITNDVPHSYFSKFYAEMGVDNRKAMIEWIMNNYNDEITLF